MDALFVVDKDYDSFFEAWDEVHRLLTFTGSTDSVMVSPMRITLKSDFTLGAPSEVGYHFRSQPTENYMTMLKKLETELHEMGQSFRMSCHSTGSAMGIEIRSDPSQPTYLALPIGDDVKHLPKFLGFYLPGFEKGYQSSKIKPFCDRFNAHCKEFLNQEQPFEFETEFRLPLVSKPKKKQVWLPKYGKIGGTFLLEEIRISQVPNSLSSLVEIMISLEKIRKDENKEVYFQFFVPEKSFHDMKEYLPYLFEKTLIFDSIQLKKADQMVDQIRGNKELNIELTDTYSMIDQPQAQIGQTCSATYMLRKTQTRGFEIRLHASWDREDVDLDEASLPLEEKTGLTFVRLS